MTREPDIYPSYDVLIRRVSDGVERVYHSESGWNGNQFWWEEGNASCDCNRALFFLRAGGEDDEDDETPCGESAYEVLRFMFPDGTFVDGPDCKVMA